MSKLLLSLLLLVCVVFVQAQNKDLSQKPTTYYNNPAVIGDPISIPFASFSESFEGVTFPPTGWSKQNPDGGTGWTRLTAGTTPFPGWTGGTVSAPTGGGTGVAYATYTTGGASANDQWLITPQITGVQLDDSLSFWLRKVFNYADNVDIKISTTTNATASFTINVATLVFVGALTDTGWKRYNYRLGNFVPANSNIYVAFRERVTDNLNDGDAILLDLVGVAPVPVELTSFRADNVNGAINLSWTTATEVNNRGFEVQRKSANSDFTTVAFINGKGTTTETQNYSYTDNVTTGTYSYRLKQVDFDGSSEYSGTIEVENIAPSKFELNANYPNPFNPSTQITFSLAVDSKVTLRVFNILGQEVATLFNGNAASGSHSLDFNASGLTTGVYVYQIEAIGIDGSSFSAAKKMILNK